jgi:deoxyribodipyrimidine photolyase-related protein
MSSETGTNFDHKIHQLVERHRSEIGDKSRYRRLRLILGDQLNEKHSWFKTVDPDTVYVIAELRQETDYVRHHVQKVCAFFAAMEDLAERLSSQGHRVIHLTLDDTAPYIDLPEIIETLSNKLQVAEFGYQRPDEFRLLEQLRSTHIENVQIVECDTEHFILPFETLDKEFKPKTHVKMEFFYRRMRKRFAVLMDGDQPIGGQWNYDASNRNKFNAKDLNQIPQPLCFSNDISPILKRIEKHQLDTIGMVGQKLLWPINSFQAESLLAFFCEYLLPFFGQYQDAMTENSASAWSLYHSRLSFALNAKIITPMRVIDRALEAWGNNPQGISIEQIEGFVRQILGWREYVRGMYWVNMPDYAEKNFFEAERSLPSFYWTGNTKMNCLKQSVGQSLEYAYAHHIQRLMVTGNFALLTGIDPKEVDEWYLGIYIDAIEWVELPNTRGMSQFADGGLVATKPYISSGSYINKMSDYCKTCHYKVKLKTEDNACPFNSLYWHFIDKHIDTLSQNQRMSMMVNSWRKMPEEKQHALLSKASELLNTIEEL